MAVSKVAGMVTVYNSEFSLLDNIDTYIKDLEVLYLIDNSEIYDENLIRQILNKYIKVKYISNGGNMGIASALNVAANKAIQEGYSYLLMLDDDSKAPTGLIASLYFTISIDEKIGIVAAQSDSSSMKSDVHEALTVITSGSLLNLTAYKDAGPFLDELFIDWVDHEYSFRMRKYGYRILINSSVRLEHRLGILKNKKFLGLINVSWRSHSPTRIYYKFRNSQYVINQYYSSLPVSFVGAVYYELVRDVFKILFLEKNKISYLKSVYNGCYDYFTNKLGKAAS
ncbi:glycosyltransferase [Spirosoma pomorum]